MKRTRKALAAILALAMMVTSLGYVFAADPVTTDPEKISRDVYLYAKDGQGTASTAPSIAVGDDASVYLALDSLNKGATKEENGTVIHEEPQYDLNTYIVRFYYDPEYFELTSDTASPIDFQLPFREAEMGDIEELPDIDPSAPPEGTLPGIMEREHGLEDVEIDGTTYKSAYLTLLLSGISFPEKKDGETWQNLCRLPLKAIKEGSTRVYLEQYGDHALQMIPKHVEGYPRDLELEIVSDSVWFNIESKGRPTPPSISPQPGDYTSEQTATLSTTETGDDVTIYYAINTDTTGNIPIGDSRYTEYTTPIPIVANTTINCYVARTIQGETQYSSVAAYSYRILPAAPMLFIRGSAGEAEYIPIATSYTAQESFTAYISDSDEFQEIPPTKDVYYTFTGLQATAENLAAAGDDPATGWVRAPRANASFAVNEAVDVRLVAVTLDTTGGINEISPVSYYRLMITPQPVVVSPEPSAEDQQPVNVTLTAGTAGAQIYYTTDNSDPRGSNAQLYDGTPILIQTTTTLRVVAKLGNTYSEVGTYLYLFEDTSGLAVSAYPYPGTYEDSVRISLSTQDYDAVIYYTTDGSDPTTDSTVFDKNSFLTIDRTTTIKAMAENTSGETGAVYTFDYTILPARPILSPESTQFEGSGTVYINKASNEDGYTVYYTTDGSDPRDPDSARTEVTGASASVNITGDTIINAVAFQDGTYGTVVTGTYIIATGRPTQPTVTLAEGTYTLQNGTVNNYFTQFNPMPSGYQIYYTVGYGSTPPDPSVTDTENTILYAGEEIPLRGNTYIRAIAVNQNGEVSDIAAFDYQIIPEAPILPPTSTIKDIDVIEVSTIEGALSDYEITVNGQSVYNTVTLEDTSVYYIDPTTGKAYKDKEKTEELPTENAFDPAYVPADGDTISVSVDATVDGVTGLETEMSYTIDSTVTTVAQPYADKNTGEYAERVIDDNPDYAVLAVRLGTMETAGTIQYHTGDGNWVNYDAANPIRLTDDTTIVARVQSGDTYSAVVSYTYSFKPLAPVITPGSGNYQSEQTVTITLDPEAPQVAGRYAIYYMRSGMSGYQLYNADPVSGAALPISVTYNTTIWSYVVKNDLDASSRRESDKAFAQYVYASDIKMPETNVPAMDENGEQISYARGLKVRFLDLYPGDDSMILYYTTDGSSPSEAANENRMIYDGSDIVLNSSATIQAVYAKRCGSCAGCTADPMGACETPSYGDIATFDYRIQRQSTGSSGSSGGSYGPSRPTASPSPSPEAGQGNYLQDFFGNEQSTHIRYLYGYTDGTVKPDNNITREELAAMIYRIMPEDYKDPSPVKGDVFPDVAADRWSALSIETLAEQDILIGYEDGTFRPEDYITRAEASAVIARYLGLEDATEANNLTDIQGHWAEGYINAMAENQLIQGYEDQTFRPDNNITRAEAVTILNKVQGRAPSLEYLQTQDFNPFSDLREDTWYYQDVLEATITHTYTLDENNLEIEWVVQ